MQNSGRTRLKHTDWFFAATVMNNYSLNETSSHARLAAKGAGYSWGLADEVYRSVFWLINRNLPAPLMLNRLLSQYHFPAEVERAMPDINGAEYQSRGHWLCPIIVGCALADRVDALSVDAAITIKELKCPLLLLPFVAEIATKLDRVIQITLESQRQPSLMATDGKHVRFSSADTVELDHVNNVKLTFTSITEYGFDTTDAVPLHNRACVDLATWDALGAFAQHTYAPASEASRNLGAGAGTTDND